MKEKKRVKKIGFKLSRLIFIVLFLLCLYFFYIYVIGDNIKNIYVKGNTYLSDQEILDLADLSSKTSYIKTTNASIIRKIKSNRFVKDVTINRKIGQIMYINVSEYKILFKRLDNNTFVLENMKEYSIEGDINAPILVNYVPNDYYKLLIKGLINIDENVLSKISEIKYDPNEYDTKRFLLYMDDGNNIYITLEKINTLNKYNAIVETLDGKKGILYLDSGNYFEVYK